jgi:hypothetical protein
MTVVQMFQTPLLKSPVAVFNEEGIWLSHLVVTRLARRTEEGRKHGEGVFSIYLAYLHFYVLYR